MKRNNSGRLKKKNFVVVGWLLINGFYLWVFSSSYKSEPDPISLIQFLSLFLLSGYVFQYFIELNKAPISLFNEHLWNQVTRNLFKSTLITVPALIMFVIEKCILESKGTLTALILIAVSMVNLHFGMKTSEIINKITRK